MLSKQQYIDLGFQMAIYPATGFLAMGKILQKVYTEIRDTGASIGCLEDTAEFNDFCRTMGFEQVWNFDSEHADYEDHWKTQLSSLSKL